MFLILFNALTTSGSVIVMGNINISLLQCKQCTQQESFTETIHLTQKADEKLHNLYFKFVHGKLQRKYCDDGYQKKLILG